MEFCDARSWASCIFFVLGNNNSEVFSEERRRVKRSEWELRGIDGVVAAIVTTAAASY